MFLAKDKKFATIETREKFVSTAMVDSKLQLGQHVNLAISRVYKYLMIFRCEVFEIVTMISDFSKSRVIADPLKSKFMPGISTFEDDIFKKYHCPFE